MRALVVDSGQVNLEERPTPSPGPGDVLVEVCAAGLNAADLLQRAGLYPAPPGVPPDIPGMELSGVVTELGEGVGAEWRGRRVAALVGGGAQATHAVVPLEHLLVLPDGIDLLDAGGFMEAFTTAHDALVSQAHLLAGERLLVTGAAGGVGVAAVQIGAALGASVTALTRTDEFHERLLDLGAYEAVVADDLDAVAPFDVVLELVGAATLGPAVHHLRPRARVVVIGVASGGHRLELDLRGLMGTRATITGSTLRGRTRAEKASAVRLVAGALAPRWARGELRVVRDRVFPLAEGSDAYDAFARPGKFGKILLRVEP